MQRTFTATGDYNQVGGKLSSEIAEAFKDDPTTRKRQAVLVLEHLLGVCGLGEGETRNQAHYVTLDLDLDSPTSILTFKATKL